MPAKHATCTVIEEAVGRWNADIALGWESGLRGLERYNGGLRKRQPPAHFELPQNRNRLADWYIGQDAALRYRQSEMRRTLCFYATGPGGLVSGTLQGWTTPRHRIVTRLEAQGCRGAVTFHYLEQGTLRREVTCRI